MPLLHKIEVIKATRFEELWERGVAFMPRLQAKVKERYPHESQPWELVPAYHAMFGSTVRADEKRTINQDVRTFIESEISGLVAEFV